jgi:hypothetical protein
MEPAAERGSTRISTRSHHSSMHPRPPIGVLVTAMLVAFALITPPAEALMCADIACGDLDANGQVNASDVLRLLRRAVGLPNELACPLVCTETTTTTTTVTTTTTATTTTTLASSSCAVTFRLEDDLNLLAVQFDVGYGQTTGTFVGEAGDVSCTLLVGGVSVGLFDDDPAQRLAISISDVNESGGLNGPIDLVRCDFEGAPPMPLDFAITFLDAVRDRASLGSADSGVCGAPVTGLDRPTVRDALWVFYTAVGQPLDGDCVCECDVNHDGVTTVADGLRITRATLDPAVVAEFDCDACGFPPEVKGPGDPVSIVVSDVDCF